jgi:hypothetical protein
MVQPLNGQRRMTIRLRRGAGIFFLGALFITTGPAFGQDQDADRSIPAGQAIPHGLAQAERNKLFVKDLFNPLSFVESAASAGFGQWRDRPPEWGEGGAGFGRRYASSFAQHLTGETLKFGLASILHEDNRYVPSGRTGIAGRTLYALVSTFRSRDDEGQRQMSYSNIGSLAGASLLSRTWQPASSGGAGNGAVNFGVAVAFAGGMNVVREFLHR